MRVTLPITKSEFSWMLQKTQPPSGWPNTIAVANSGGADSTCLLFLLHEYLSDKGRPRDTVGSMAAGKNQRRMSSGKASFMIRPTHENESVNNDYTSNAITDNSKFHSLRRIVSLTVDHDLQSSSSTMATHCAKFATWLGLEHLTTKIAWGQGVFPPRPLPDESFERIARDARYQVLLDGMRRFGASALATGHHADDQVETILIRIGKGSSPLGAGGMRPCRRWGMGTKREGVLGWTGHEGMRKWIMRPLLTVGKDRILATCEANGLDYVTDETNFQPGTTIRNAVRYMVKHGKTDVQAFPLIIASQLQAIDDALAKLPDLTVNLNSGPDQLKNATMHLSVRVEDIERQVDRALRQCRLPSPPGTCLLSQSAVLAIKEPLVQKALVLRVLRYVSYRPWGSLHADAGRRLSSLDQIRSRIWNPAPLSSTPPFVAGAGVMWKPAIYRDNKIKDTPCLGTSSLKGGDVMAWLVCRQPPYKKNIPLQTPNSENLEDLDITPSLIGALDSWKLNEGPGFFETMYDSRFLVQFPLPQIPYDMVQAITAHQDRIVIRGNNKWCLPVIVHQLWDSSRIIHSMIATEPSTQPHWAVSNKPVAVDWITIAPIRTLGVI